ncbi:MAG: A24 family peptidase [Candidatus Erginobacter occultus]|nr:A24 family peptidase [Candidatus Erginobacter occultus]
MDIFLIAIAFLFGLSVGSFANVIVYRLPEGKSIVLPRSYCPDCRTPIAARDNIPLLGFLLLKGKCRYCRAAISPRYPLVELLMGLVFVAVYLLLSARGERLILFPFYWFFCFSLVVLSLIDFRHYILPDVLTYPLLGAGFLLAVLYPGRLGSGEIGPELLRSLIGAVVGGGSLWMIGLLGKAAFRKEAMGLGDVKLMAAVGAWQGWGMALFAVFLGALAAALVGISLILLKKARWGARLPFGPYLALGSLLTLFFGSPLIAWYLGFYR